MDLSRMTERFKDMSLNQQVGLAFGVTYLVVGAVGFAVTPGLDFASSSGDDTLWLALNPLHNVVHLAVGALLTAGALGGISRARAANVFVGAAYLAVGIFGFAAVNESWNVLAINHPDNGLHMLSAALLLGVGLRPIVRERTSLLDAQLSPAPVDKRTRQGDRVAVAELGPGVNAPVTGTYVCVTDGQEVRLEVGQTIPPCPRSTGARDHAYRVAEVATA